MMAGTLLDRLPLRLLARNRLSVFVFHKVPGRRSDLELDDIDLAAFCKLLDFVEERFSVLPLEDAVLGVRSGKLPGGAACITFDDGYADWQAGVIPELVRRKLHATFFITTGQFDGPPLWHERAAQALGQPGLASIELPGYASGPLGTPQARGGARIELERFLKYQPLKSRNAMVESLEAAAGVSPATLPRMKPELLRQIDNCGLAVGAHTINHPILALCDPAQAMHEIGAAREILESIIGGPVRTFAYPNGQPVKDFSAEHIAMVKRAGYTSAVTTQAGAADRHTSEFQIPRFTPWGPGGMRIALQLGRNLMHRVRYLPETGN